MSNVFVSAGISLDGYIAGPNGGPETPLGEGGLEIHNWMFKQQSFLRHLGLEGGETNNKDSDIIDGIFNRTGTTIIGKRMFEEGEANWPEEAPFRTPVFVLTHEKREPWERKGGTTFYFVNDGIHGALEQAKQVAGDKDIRIGGGADVIRQYLHAGLVEELELHIAPLILGRGVRLFDQADASKFSLEIVDATNSVDVTHVMYRVKPSH